MIRISGRSTPRAGLDPELIDEQPPPFPVALQRISLASTAIQRNHQLPAQLLAERFLLDQRLELTHETFVASKLELCVDALLESGEPQLGEAPGGRERERLLPELHESRAAPERECLTQELGAASGITRAPRSLGERFEATEVDVLASNAEHVARRAGLDRPRAEHLPQLRHIDLQDLAGARRRGVAPDAFDQRVDRHDAVRVEQQAGEQGSRLTGRKLDRHVVDAGLERSEQPKFGHLPEIIRP